MNESTLTQLKIIVERVVRPVRATTARKRKMREELLAHVTAVFEDEAKCGDESAALGRTAERFGSPADLTPQLQAAIPAADAAACFVEALVGFPPRETALRQAVRHALLTAVLCAAGLALMFVVIGRWSEWLTVARLPAVLTPLYMGVLMFCASLLARGMSQALFGPSGRNWHQVTALGLAAWLLVPGVTFVWCFLFFTGDFVASLLEVAPLLLPGLLAPVVLLIAVSACNAEIRHHEEWRAYRLTLERGPWHERIDPDPTQDSQTMFFGVAMASLVITLAKFGALRTQYLEEWARLPIEPSS